MPSPKQPAAATSAAVTNQRLGSPTLLKQEREDRFTGLSEMLEGFEDKARRRAEEYDTPSAKRRGEIERPPHGGNSIGTKSRQHESNIVDLIDGMRQTRLHRSGQRIGIDHFIEEQQPLVAEQCQAERMIAFGRFDHALFDPSRAAGCEKPQLSLKVANLEAEVPDPVHMYASYPVCSGSLVEPLDLD